MMRTLRCLLLAGSLLAALIFTTSPPAPAPARTSSASRIAQVAASLNALPLAIEENRGQADPVARFVAHSRGFTLAVTPDALVLAPPSASSIAPLRFAFVGANPNAAIDAEAPLPGVVNYFIGNDPRAWRTNVPTAAQVRYTGLYPGIDLTVHGTEGGVFEYDTIVAPGADPSAFAFTISGATGMRLDEGSGDLILTTAAGEVRQHAPVAYQEIGGTRQLVPSQYELRGDGSVGFRVGTYDRAQPLVIDPAVSELYGTYLGGSGKASTGGNRDSGLSIAVDAAGNAYITGDTASPDFPLQSPIQNSLHSLFDAYVTKLNPAGNALVYSTYLGGNHGDTGAGIAVNSAGEVFVTGRTGSTDFPTQNPIQSTNHISQGTGIGSNVFVTKLNAAGNALLYSTYLGGSGDSLLTLDAGNGIAVDGSGNAYIAGATNSTDFPTKNPLFTGGGAFVAELNPAGSALVYSTYLGGSTNEGAFAIAVDSAGEAFVTGGTSSTSFPTKNPLQATNHSTTYTAFVTKIATGGTALVYSTYLGGSGTDQGYGIAVDAARNAYITGQTTSADFPIHNPVQPTGNSNGTAFVTEINAAGSAFVYSTYLGGSGGDKGNGIAVDSAGRAYVTGQTMSMNFPVLYPFQSTNHDPTAGNAFVTRVAAGGGALEYSTYLGGSVNAEGGGDAGYGIAVDGAGNAYITGSAGSTDFPVLNAFQPVNHNPSFNGTGFVVKFASFIAPPAPLPPPKTGGGTAGNPSTLPQARTSGGTAGNPHPLPPPRP